MSKNNKFFLQNMLKFTILYSRIDQLKSLDKTYFGLTNPKLNLKIGQAVVC